MPALSSFYGIIIYMYYSDNKEHKSPHIHVKYQGDEVILKIPNGEILAGKLPNNKLKITLAWIEIHKEELMANWELAIANESLYKINPLQ